MARKWIAGAIKHPGALHKELGVPQGDKIPKGKIEAAAKKPGILGRRARLAETLEGFHKGSAQKQHDHDHAKLMKHGHKR